MSAEPIPNAALQARLLELEAEVATLRARLAGGTGEARYRETFERAAVGVAHVGMDGAFLRVNRRFCEILGYSEAELLQRTFVDITHPDDLDPNLSLQARLTDGEIDRFEMEKRYLRPTGEIVWTDLSVSLERAPDGAPRNFISVVSDIGPRKQNEERLNFLLGELSHRSKNVLAVVQAAVRQIAADVGSVREFQAAVDDRIHGIAAAQDVLVRHDHRGAPVAELVAGQLSAFVRPTDPRVTMQGEPLELGAAASHSLALALHELATNACKYGALSTAEGRVCVAWGVEAGGRFVISWVESDGPSVTPPARQGFGRRVIEQMVAASLGGAVELRFDPEGVAWRLDAPLEAVRG